MTESSLTPTKEQLFSEINEYAKTHHDRMRFFNNFFSFLPGGSKTRLPDEVLDMKHEDDIHSSEKRRKLTAREFLQDCEDAVKEAGYSNKEVIISGLDWHQLRKTHQLPYTDSKAKQMEDKYFRMTTEIYTTLRLSGYSHSDLIG